MGVIIKLERTMKVGICKLMLFAGSVGWVTGCEQPLFTPTKARTPYERYQILRGQSRPATEQKAYGAQEPALRQRLEPLDRL